MSRVPYDSWDWLQTIVTPPVQKIAGVKDGSLGDTGSIDACLSFPTHISAPSRLESSLLEVLQMDFEVEELSTPLDSQVIVWKLELPVAPAGVAKTEGAMRIYTTQRDFVGLAPLVMVSWLASAAPRHSSSTANSSSRQKSVSNASFVVG